MLVRPGCAPHPARSPGKGPPSRGGHFADRPSKSAVSPRPKTCPERKTNAARGYRKAPDTEKKSEMENGGCGRRGWATSATAPPANQLREATYVVIRCGRTRYQAPKSDYARLRRDAIRAVRFYLCDNMDTIGLSASEIRYNEWELENHLKTISAMRILSIRRFL